MGDQQPTIYRTLGRAYAERVLPSILQETLKAAVAEYNASQLITQREVVSKEIRRILQERAMSVSIALDDVSIMKLSFGSSQLLSKPSLWWRRHSRTKDVLLSVLRERPSVLSSLVMPFQTTQLSLH